MIDREVKSARTIFFLLQRRQTLEYEKPRPDNATDSSKLQDNTKQRERESFRTHCSVQCCNDIFNKNMRRFKGHHYFDWLSLFHLAPFVVFWESTRCKLKHKELWTFAESQPESVIVCLHLALACFTRIGARASVKKRGCVRLNQSFPSCRLEKHEAIAHQFALSTLGWAIQWISVFHRTQAVFGLFEGPSLVPYTMCRAWIKKALLDIWTLLP